MPKVNINLNDDSEILLSDVKSIALRLGADVSNKEKLINYALKMLALKLEDGK